MKKQEKIITKIEFLLEELKNIKEEKQPEKILVPECIKIHKFDEDILGIVFNKRQVLYGVEGLYDISTAKISYIIENNLVQCELIRCEYSDLENGDLFHYSDSDVYRIEDLRHYGIKIEIGFVCKSKYGIEESLNKYEYYYKLKPIN